MTKYCQSRVIKEKFVPSLLSGIPLFLFRKLTKTDLIIPYYHAVSDKEILHIKHLYQFKNVKQFKDDLNFLLKNFKPVSLFDVICFVRNDNPLPEKAFLLTFDDGFREIHDIVAPILLEKGVSATFFINSGFIDNRSLCYQHKASLLVEYLQESTSLNMGKKINEILTKKSINNGDIASCILSIKYKQKDIINEIAQSINIDFNDYLLKKEPYLTSHQIQILIKQGFAIGAHSIDHPLYSLLTLEEQVYQTIESVNYIREKYCLNYGAFAFPHSDNGVTKEFFTQIHGSGLVDISFGTGGMIKDAIPNHFQRFSLEKPAISAKKIIAYQYARKLVRRVRGNGEIDRA